MCVRGGEREEGVEGHCQGIRKGGMTEGEGGERGIGWLEGS